MHKSELWGGSELEVLGRDEELALARRYRASGDRRLEDRLVRSQLRLVAHLARQYHLDAGDEEDVIQQGALGVVEAVRRFDPERGNRLASYAAWWIRAYQLRYLMANYRLVRLGSTQAQRKIFWRLRSERARLAAEGGEVDAQALAERLQVEQKAAEETAQRMDAREVSLDAEGEAGPMIARIASPEPSAESRVEAEELSALVRDEVGRLRQELGRRDRALLDARFREEPTTLAELGKRLGVSRERARQLEERVLHKLRARVEERLAA